MSRALSDLLVERLIDWGVDTIFGYPGDGINGLFEALRTHQDRLRFIQVRHEESAALAACGYAKFTGRLGVCLATSGPGGVHLLNGLYDAKFDGQPVLAITGHTYHDLIGTQSQQDVNLHHLFADVAAFSELVTGPAHVINALDHAVRVALGRRTVAHLTIPKDLQTEPYYTSERSDANIPGHSGGVIGDGALMPHPDLIRKAADVINAGKRVAILAGRGSLGCGDLLEQLAEKVGGPVIKALLGKAAVPDDSPYTTGGLGLLGTSPSYEAMQACDTLLLAGTNFPYLEFYPKPGQARCVQIDRDPERLGLRCPVEVGLTGDSRRILEALVPLVNRKDDRSFLQSAQQGMADWRRLMEERGTREDKPLKPQVVAHRLNQFLTDDAIVVTDCGTVTTWAARHITIRGRMQFSSSGILATMANGLPYSIAAAAAYPGRQVVCLMGDGGLAMLMAELATLAKYRLPVKVIVFKNHSLGQIKWEQLAMEGNPEYGCDLPPIEFAAVARACGVAGFSVDDPAQVEGVYEQAFAHPGPALIDATVDPHEPVMPGHVTLKQAASFAQALLRGQPDGWRIVETISENKVREMV